MQEDGMAIESGDCNRTTFTPHAAYWSHVSRLSQLYIEPPLPQSIIPRSASRHHYAPPPRVKPSTGNKND
ncbi:hypothetical protein E2C01_093167 [Portunus trituberculatus]|uniref:Uncharacterized protein n=1 Tax=Portunus trituberculatus TaxID=210409 RepID=A0A5B7JP32_PORTR|nr:hypothetical protein [Portunus trituberculatus]